MYIGLHVKYRVFLSGFNEYWIFSGQILKKSLIRQISWESVKWEQSCSTRMGRRTDGGTYRLTDMKLIIYGNKMPTRCNRGFYCRSYCLLNMFQAPLCPSSGAQEYYIVVVACGISCCGFQVVGLVWSWGLCVWFAGCCSILQTGHITHSSTPDQQLENHRTKYHR